jgi:hypothetical protein
MTRYGQRALAILAVTLALLAAATMSRAGSATSGPVASPTGQVTATGKLEVRRFSQTATLLPSGKVLIAGGMEENGKYDASAELYDPATGKFTPTASMKTARSCHTATLLPNGQVLIAGGADGSGLNLSSAEIYDPAPGSFHSTGNLTGPRCGAAAVLLKSGKVLLVGGDGVREDERVATAELYDPATGRFTATGSMHVPRNTHTAVLLKDGRVLVVGGSSAGRYPNARIESSAEMYDPATGRFSGTGSMKTGRHKLAAAVLPDGDVLVVGGSGNRDWREMYASAEIFSPATGRFSPAGDMNSPRFKLTHAVVRLPDGRVLIAGGAERPEIYDPATKKFHAVSGGVGDGRYFSSATVLSDGRVLIAGGYGNDPMAGAVPNAWIYQP